MTSQFLWGYVALVAAMLLLAGALLQWRITRRFIRKAHKALGKVAGFDRHWSGPASDRMLMYSTIIRFTDDRGTEHTCTSKFGSSGKLSHIGDPVEILYDPDDPNKAESSTFGPLWGGFTFLLVAACVLFVVAGLFLTGRLG